MTRSLCVSVSVYFVLVFFCKLSADLIRKGISTIYFNVSIEYVKKAKNNYQRNITYNKNPVKAIDETSCCYPKSGPT